MTSIRSKRPSEASMLGFGCATVVPGASAFVAGACVEAGGVSSLVCMGARHTTHTAVAYGKGRSRQDLAACPHPPRGAGCRRMKTYSFKELTTSTLAEVAAIRHEPTRPEVWEELSGRELSEVERAEL